MKWHTKFLALFIFAAALPLQAQPAIAGHGREAGLPDAPQPVLPEMVQKPQQNQQNVQQITGPNPPSPAPRLAKYIQPSQRAQFLSSKDKLELAAWEQLQPYSFGTQILAAGWEHMLDSDPKYGTDKAGFGERLGAASIRQDSQAIFSDGISAAVFHQDPRYYRKGSGKIVDRIVYAASRVLITRTDDGREAANYSQLVGYAGASALTMTYYPAVSATWSETAAGYFVSLAGAALGNGIHEFQPDLIRLARHTVRRHRSAERKPGR